MKISKQDKRYFFLTYPAEVEGFGFVSTQYLKDKFKVWMGNLVGSSGYRVLPAEVEEVLYIKANLDAVVQLIPKRYHAPTNTLEVRAFTDYDESHGRLEFDTTMVIYNAL